MTPMSPDTLEAESFKYHNATWHFRQLESGLFAIYNHEYQLQACVSWGLACDLYLKRPKWVSPNPSTESASLRSKLGLKIDLQKLGVR